LEALAGGEVNRFTRSRETGSRGNLPRSWCVSFGLCEFLHVHECGGVEGAGLNEVIKPKGARGEDSSGARNLSLASDFPALRVLRGYEIRTVALSSSFRSCARRMGEAQLRGQGRSEVQLRNEASNGDRIKAWVTTRMAESRLGPGGRPCA